MTNNKIFMVHSIENPVIFFMLLKRYYFFKGFLTICIKKFSPIY